MGQNKAYRLSEYIDDSDVHEVLTEIRKLAAEMEVGNFSVIERTYYDIIRLFEGRFPGYKANNARYHNLQHTISVALAVARLLHGLRVEGKAFSPGNVFLCIIAALFHDTGLIQTTEDIEGTGAKYTIGHELRSIELLRNYLPSQGFDAEAVEDCANVVLYTILNKPLQEIPFRSEDVTRMGHVLGTGDLLAQFADRVYLEKLPLLFFEFQEGGVTGYKTALDLLVSTPNFYEAIIKKRIFNDLNGVGAAMKAHFRARWDVDSDLYMETIEKNMAYLNMLKEKCGDDYDCYLRGLRRGNIIKNLYGDGW
ncbi:MAG: hypothetical protein A2077_00310 [Nitrospirae bacterium GWC2_46_6]|nr:MAG: hypothetical protein A2077_00310 [Nitrospirae bacterium GWC2_46_6]OGW21395.1 MAG: hypothetical protein A2Z82_05825 [Nitrospirae bacterium GWA2_46_11]OGW23546.1 MAG: hypothetical protein A2X55_02115 [Nitrospirae bacterium GWB2_47_37]HAK88957.1 hypothetical protein [Nitrospiraceae bacterium]HCZ12481.1 hypothetical protein [Nitrospiraceae bacterium]